MRFLERWLTRHTFSDGWQIRSLHRYALEVIAGERRIDVGFEAAYEPGIDRLIHEHTIRVWRTRTGEVPVTATERAEVMKRLIEYCSARGMTYRVVQSEGGDR